MATLVLLPDTLLLQETVAQLTIEAGRLNRTLGDPTKAAKAPAAQPAQPTPRA